MKSMPAPYDKSFSATFVDDFNDSISIKKKSFQFLADLYIGDGNACPFTCGIISARAAANVFSIVYLVFHMALAIKVCESQYTQIERSVVVVVTIIHCVCMSQAFWGLCFGRSELVIPFLILQLIETAIFTTISVVFFVVWSVAAYSDDLLELFSQTKSIELDIVVIFFICVAAHIILAMYIRASITLHENSKYVHTSRHCLTRK